jgi:hypothetical protein
MRWISSLLLFATLSCQPSPRPSRADAVASPATPSENAPEPPADFASRYALCDGIARTGFDPVQIRAAVECHVRIRHGAGIVSEANSAASSLMATAHQGLPRPIRRPDGSWDYQAPMIKAAVRGRTGWQTWRGGVLRPLPAASSAEIDSILSDPAFWAEPARVPPTCTDAGAQRLVVRHAGRQTVRQQSCGPSGLTGRLFALAIAG